MFCVLEVEGTELDHNSPGQRIRTGVPVDHQKNYIPQNCIIFLLFWLNGIARLALVLTDEEKVTEVHECLNTEHCDKIVSCWSSQACDHESPKLKLSALAKA